MRKIATALLLVILLLGMIAQPVPAYAAETKYYIKLNRQQNCVTVYEKDEKGKYTVPVKAFVCSTGANNATPKGVFKLGEKYRWRELDGGVYGQYSTRITGRVLFHSVFYHTTDPSTLYYNAYNKLGTSVSHGCVRLCVADAKWIYDNCESGTPVEIYDGKDPGPLGKPKPVKISTSHKNRGWDPTDPNPANPWELSAPVITGAKNMTVERGSAASKLLAGVKAVDFAWNPLELSVSGKYNLDKTGKYTISYKATDMRGKVGEKKVTITVRDTKPPTVSLAQKKMRLEDEDGDFSTIGELKDYLRQYATAMDSGKLLADKYLRFDAKELWKAWKNKIYGTYEVYVYAKDAAGNMSNEKTLTVRYVGPPVENTGEEVLSGETETGGGSLSGETETGGGNMSGETETGGEGSSGGAETGGGSLSGETETGGGSLSGETETGNGNPPEEKETGNGNPPGTEQTENVQGW